MFTSSVEQNKLRISDRPSRLTFLTDAAVNPGMSGGALVDPQGRLVGLIDGIFTKKADIDAGVNFAISVPLIQQSLASQLKAGVQF